jgi:hypothetical protein
LIQSTNLDADLSGVPQDLQVYAFAANPGSEIVLLQSSFTGDFVPPLRGEKSVIFYFANSEQGNMIGSGGLYTNIQVWSEQYPDLPPETFVQDNDGTILVDVAGTIIRFENPAEVDEQVLYRGKQVYVANISDGPVHVRDNIFGGDQTIPPGGALLLQNDARLWYIIADRTPPVTPPPPVTAASFAFSAPAGTNIEAEETPAPIYFGQGSFSTLFSEVAYPIASTTFKGLSAALNFTTAPVAGTVFQISLVRSAAPATGSGNYAPPESIFASQRPPLSSDAGSFFFNFEFENPIVSTPGSLYSVAFALQGPPQSSSVLNPSFSLY